MNRIDPQEIVELFKERKTYEEISVLLQERNPGIRVFSVRSVKRFCRENGLSPRLQQVHLDEMVSGAVEEVLLLMFLQ